MEKVEKSHGNERYIPSNPDEEYMNSRQLKYFKSKLLEWKNEFKKRIYGDSRTVKKYTT